MNEDRFYGGAEAALVVTAIDVQDPGNLGAIVRVAEAAGATGFVAAGGSANPFGWKALRGSMGSALRLPIASELGAEEAVAAARAHGCRVVATVPRDGRSLFDVDLTGPIAILVGGEGPGLDAVADGRRRRARHDPDAGAGRIAERRSNRRADRLRSAPSANPESEI